MDQRNHKKMIQLDDESIPSVVFGVALARLKLLQQNLQLAS